MLSEKIKTTLSLGIITDIKSPNHVNILEDTWVSHKNRILSTKI